MIIAKEIFISYSFEDLQLASTICTDIEETVLSCWIALMDLPAGKDWADSILDGIEKARLLLLILSSRSNQSPQVKREVERAVANGLHILTFRSENVIPSRSLEYFVSSSQWFDGWTESKDG